MDQRPQQTKIVEGAGLEESRLNVDFIRWLQKWGTPLLLALCVVAAGYSGWSWWQRTQQRALDEAFAQLSAAQTSGSPDNLLRVAREHAGRGAVAPLATLGAADVYYNSALLRLAPGGKPENEADKLNDEQRKTNLEQAKKLYEDVLSQTQGSRERALFAINARFGIAATLATMGDVAGAQAAYDAIADVAKEANLPGLADRAARAKADLSRAVTLPPLLTKEQTAAAARPVPQTPTPGLDPALSAPLGPLGPVPLEGVAPMPDMAAPEPVAPPAEAETPAPTPPEQPAPQNPTPPQ